MQPLLLLTVSSTRVIPLHRTFCFSSNLLFPYKKPDLRPCLLLKRIEYTVVVNVTFPFLLIIVLFSLLFLMCPQLLPIQFHRNVKVTWQTSCVTNGAVICALDGGLKETCYVFFSWSWFSLLGSLNNFWIYNQGASGFSEALNPFRWACSTLNKEQSISIFRNIRVQKC